MTFGFLRSIRRLLAFVGGTLAVIAVVGLFAFLALRIAIHGREVTVPNLEGMSDADASAAAKDLGLNLSVENRFYSPAVAQNHVLSQAPAAGATVRRGWQVRITESLGAQSVSVPDVTGQTERPASLVLRRLQLEVSSVAHLPAPSPAGIVLAQSPAANSKGLNSPKVAFLVSDEDTSSDIPAFVMPSVVGTTLGAASLRLASAGLHIATAQAPELPAPSPVEDATAAPLPPVATGAATITSQSPLPGYKVTRADTIHVTLSH